MATARLEIRLDRELKKKVERAAVILGRKNTTDYVTRLMEEDANRVIEQFENFTLPNNIFDKFIEACDNAIAPNNALLKAAATEQSF